MIGPVPKEPLRCEMCGAPATHVITHITDPLCNHITCSAHATLNHHTAKTIAEAFPAFVPAKGNR